jgi:threonine dehydrogenase-like Zn-dependent dehydrogenase
MKALCWHGTGDVRIDNVADPKIENPRDAIVKITASGICGSDLHLFDGFIPTMEAKASPVFVQFQSRARLEATI